MSGDPPSEDAPGSDPTLEVQKEADAEPATLDAPAPDAPQQGAGDGVWRLRGAITIDFLLTQSLDDVLESYPIMAERVGNPEALRADWGSEAPLMLRMALAQLMFQDVFRPDPAATRPDGAITMAEVKRHTTSDDCWICVGGRAYDVTPWLEKHPAGAGVILRWAGDDATEIFSNSHRGHYSRAPEMLAKHLKGPLCCAFPDDSEPEGFTPGGFDLGGDDDEDDEPIRQGTGDVM